MSQRTWEGVEEVAREAAAHVADALQQAAESTRTFLASEEGRELRRVVASTVIVGAPFIAQLPVFRHSPAGRLLRTAAVAGLLVRGAEWLRDWEPREAR